VGQGLRRCEATPGRFPATRRVRPGSSRPDRGRCEYRYHHLLTGRLTFLQSSSSAESPSRKRSRIDDSVTTSDLPLAKRLNLNTDTDGFADVPGLNEQVSLTRKRARDESDDSVTASDDSVTTSDASVAAPDCPPSKRQHTFDVDKDDIFDLCDQVVRDPSILDTLSDEQGQTYIRRVSLALGKFQEIPGGA
jgi:hypothetical protein